MEVVGTRQKDSEGEETAEIDLFKIIKKYLYKEKSNIIGGNNI